MTFEIKLGWWLVPVAVTLATLIWQWWVHKDDPPSYGYGSVGSALGQCLTLAAAIIVSLVAWLVWALAR